MPAEVSGNARGGSLHDLPIGKLTFPCPNLQIGKLSVPMTQDAKWEIELPIAPFWIWVISQIRMTQFQIDRASPGPGRIKERSKSADLAFFPNCPDEHLQVGEAIGLGGCAHLGTASPETRWLQVPSPSRKNSRYFLRPGIVERSFPITQHADRGIKERSNFVYLAFFLNFLNEHFEIRQPIGHCGCAHLKPLGE